MVRAQMLSELEEIIAYKQYADQPERQATMRRTWMRRCGATECALYCADLSPGYRGVNRT